MSSGPDWNWIGYMNSFDDENNNGGGGGGNLDCASKKVKNLVVLDKSR